MLVPTSCMRSYLGRRRHGKRIIRTSQSLLSISEMKNPVVRT